jgi:HAD superfamily hydrolase (TIGR01509 family)
MMLKAIIFDMDGVIVDSEDSFLRSKQQLLQELGISVNMSYHYQFFGSTSVSTWTKIKNEFNLPLSVETYIQRANEIRENIVKAEGIHPIPGVLDLIKYFQQSGVKLAVASSSPMQDITTVMDTLGIRDCFQTLVSAGACQNSKPFPDVFLLAAEKLGVAPKDCLVIEDSRNMTCVGYRNPNFVCQDLDHADLVVEYFSNLNIDQCRQLVG